jgi:hypothetical protein
MTLVVKRKAGTVTITETEQVAQPVAKIKSGIITEEQQKIDRFVALNQQIEDSGILPLIEERETLKKELAAVAKDYPPEKNVVLKGTIGEAEFSRASNTTEIVDKAGLIEKLGQAVFNECAKIGIEELKKYLSENELAQFTASGYGSRRLQAIRPYE